MDKLRLGVIGAGKVVELIYRDLYFKSRYSELVSIEAVCDVRPARLEWFAKAHAVPPGRCFRDYREMIAAIALDAVAVNTPDSLHCRPVVDALDAGLDVILAKPLADKVADAHAMIQAVKRSGRFLGVDFHKRHDPRVLEAARLFAARQYGQLQHCVWYMMNRLLVSDPNRQPTFFASPDYARTNSPMTFLGVHAADSFMTITGLTPVEVRATGYKQKLRSLRPVSVDGYDLIDAEVRFSNGVVAHFVVGWHLPNTAYTGAVQWARFVCTEGMVDIALDAAGYCEINRDGIVQRNPVFQATGPDGLVGGFGISSPGTILTNILRDRTGGLGGEERAGLLSPLALGFYTTLICHGAHASLAAAGEAPAGVLAGEAVDLGELIRIELGREGAGEYL